MKQQKNTKKKRLAFLVPVLAITASLSIPPQPAQAGSRGEPIASLIYEHETDARILLDDDTPARDGSRPSVSVHTLHTQATIPLHRGERFFLLSGLRASTHRFLFNDLHLRDLNTYDLAIPFTLLAPLEQGPSLLAILSPGVSSDLQRKIDHHATTASFILLLSHDLSDTWQLSLGGGYARIFGDDAWFPALSATWTPSPDWELNLSFPRPYLRHSLTDRLHLRASFKPAGGKWNITDPRTREHQSGQHCDFQFRGWHIGLNTEYELTESLALYIGAGRTFRRKYTIKSKSETILDHHARDTFGLGAGLVLRR